MPPHSPSRRRSRLAALGFVGLLVGALALPATASAADPTTISEAESAMVEALNANRAAAGLVAARVDSRLMNIARARSNDMATKHYFSHTQPDGRNVFNILNAQNITWYNAGEIIAWNNYPTLGNSVDAADAQWMASPGHRAIALSGAFNYVGVGLGIDASTGKKLWTAVFMKGPDRTGARATVAAPTVRVGTVSGTRIVGVAWRGADVRLQVLTSGLYSFQVQRRVDGSAWATIWSSTTRTSLATQVRKGHVYEFRIRARDRAGNYGAWQRVAAAL